MSTTSGFPNLNAPAQARSDMDTASYEEILSRAEYEPGYARALNMQKLYDRFIAPEERAEFAKALDKLNATQQAQLRASQGRNEDLSRRMGFGGSLGSGMRSALSSRVANEFARQRRQLESDHQRRLNTPDRFARLDNIARASERQYAEDAQRDFDAAQGVGAVTSVVGDLLGLAVPAAGAVVKGLGQLYAIPQGLISQQNLSNAADLGSTLRRRVRGVEGTDFTGRAMTGNPGGLNYMGGGAHQGRTGFGQYEDDDDGRGGRF